MPEEKRKPVRVLIVEDSAVVRELLVRILSSDAELSVVGTAGDGEEALSAVERHRPDVITMDIHMPRMNGIEATRRVMQTTPTPIVVVSGSVDPEEAATSFGALEAGALAVMQRPEGPMHPDHEQNARELIRMVKLMSEVRVVRRWNRPQRPVDDSTATPLPAAASGPVAVVAIGASTGGPPVLRTILSGLPREFPVPLLVVQHMVAGFLDGFAGWLGAASAVTVRVATDGEVAVAGCAYLAPDGLQMGIGRNGRISLSLGGPAGHRPSASVLFRSVAASFGARAVAGLLTGMGRDGVDELKVLRDLGAVTFVQDESSSVVWGMPGEAVKAGAAEWQLSPERIAPALVEFVNGRK
jgi:two-component system chemotaxis response regulator CheB